MAQYEAFMIYEFRIAFVCIKANAIMIDVYINWKYKCHLASL